MSLCLGLVGRMGAVGDKHHLQTSGVTWGDRVMASNADFSTADHVDVPAPNNVKTGDSALSKQAL